MGRGNRVTIIEGLESRVLLSASRLALISDFGTLQGSEADVANLVKQWNTASPLDAIITSGDNDQNNGDDYVNRVGNYYDEFIYGRGSATERFLPAPGNHDWGYPSGRNTLTYYEDFFALPNAAQGNTSGNERYYNYKVGAVEVFVIDSDTHEPDGTSSTSVQAEWLQSALASSTAPWQIVSFHHAPYSSASGHGNTAYMQWAFQEWGADLVVSGHDHIYERINVNGLRYVVNGTGGWDSLSGIATTPVAGSEVRYNAENGAILLEANANSLSYSFINTRGETIDTYSMTALPNIAVTAANASEAGQVGGFTFTRSNILTGDVTVNFTISGTATSGTDYQSVGASVLIPDGVTSVTIPVTAINDTLAEGDETVILTITDNPAYIRRNTTATATIADDDLATLSFQQGLGGYSGTSDTQLRQANPTTDSSAAASINIDGDEPAGSGSDVQGLLRFDDIFGPAPAQIPLGSQIISATLELQVFNSGDAIKVHRMLANWLDTATWSSMGAGVQADGIEAAATADITTGAIAVGKLSLNVTNALAAWAADPAANRGWALLPTGSDGVDLYSSESSNTRPKLIVSFVANHAPVAADDAFNGTEDSVLAVAAPGLLANDNDIDENPLSALLINGPSNGSLILNPDGSFTYTPGVNFNGTDSFTYAASDGAASSVPVVVTIAVDPANDAPIANDDGYTIAENTTLIVAALGVLANDSDPDGDALSATLVSAPSHGTLTLDPEGSFVYTPDAEYVGPDSFTYMAGDGPLASDAAIVSITVTRTNVAPAAVDDAYAVSEDAVLDASTLLPTAPSMSSARFPASPPSR
ncbi:MAG: Ig-like domain-containing protein [Planctomycetota bacterium]|nr:Ig-like domain-containing protein [Planctomycetota bacterium]